MVLPQLPGNLYGYEQMLTVESQEVLLQLRKWLARGADRERPVGAPASVRTPTCLVGPGRRGRARSGVFRDRVRT